MKAETLTASGSTGVIFVNDFGGLLHDIGLYIKWPQTSSGQIVIETADDANFTGQWCGLGSAVSSPSTPTEQFNSLRGNFKVIRLRIVDNPGNVTVSATFFFE